MWAHIPSGTIGVANDTHEFNIAFEGNTARLTFKQLTSNKWEVTSYHSSNGNFGVYEIRSFQAASYALTEGQKARYPVLNSTDTEWSTTNILSSADSSRIWNTFSISGTTGRLSSPYADSYSGTVVVKDLVNIVDESSGMTLDHAYTLANNETFNGVFTPDDVVVAQFNGEWLVASLNGYDYPSAVVPLTNTHWSSSIKIKLLSDSKVAQSANSLGNSNLKKITKLYLGKVGDRHIKEAGYGYNIIQANDDVPQMSGALLNDPNKITVDSNSHTTVNRDSGDGTLYFRAQKPIDVTISNSTTIIGGTIYKLGAVYKIALVSQQGLTQNDWNDPDKFLNNPAVAKMAAKLMNSDGTVKDVLFRADLNGYATEDYVKGHVSNIVQVADKEKTNLTASQVNVSAGTKAAVDTVNDVKAMQLTYASSGTTSTVTMGATNYFKFAKDGAVVIQTALFIPKTGYTVGLPTLEDNNTSVQVVVTKAADSTTETYKLESNVSQKPITNIFHHTVNVEEFTLGGVTYDKVYLFGGQMFAERYTPFGSSSSTNRISPELEIKRSVTGWGTKSLPFAIFGRPGRGGADSTVLAPKAVLELGDLTDVSTTGVSTGQVLTRKSDGTYGFSTPTAGISATYVSATKTLKLS